MDRAYASVMTSLDLVEGDILSYLEENGATLLETLCADLDWPAQYVHMAVGALTRSRQVAAFADEGRIYVQPSSISWRNWGEDPVPEIWGG